MPGYNNHFGECSQRKFIFQRTAKMLTSRHSRKPKTRQNLHVLSLIYSKYQHRFPQKNELKRRKQIFKSITAFFQSIFPVHSTIGLGFRSVIKRKSTNKIFSINYILEEKQRKKNLFLYKNNVEQESHTFCENVVQ